MGKIAPTALTDIRMMIEALDKYINTVSQNIESMKRAAITCTTAMSSDSISMEMVGQLTTSRKLLEASVNEAAGIKKKLEEEETDIMNKVSSFINKV